MNVPHNIETERALLGCILVDDAQFDTVTAYIDNPAAFHNEMHRKIFNAMLQVKQQNQTIDLITVSDRMPDQMAYIAELTSAVVSSANAEHYAKTIRDRFYRRELFRACEQGVKEAVNDEHQTAADVAAKIDSLILKATGGMTTNRMATAEELAYMRLKKYMEDASAEQYFFGVPTGFADLDNLIDGLGCGENVIIAARPSMGKTALGLNIALNAAKNGHPVDFFSLEMSKERVMDRIFCMEAQINAKRMRLRNLSSEEEKKMEKACTVIQSLPLRIYDGTMNTAQIRSALARKAVPGKSIAFVDFLTLVSDSPTLSPHERYGTIAKAMQGMAMEFNIPMVTLAQLSRKVEERGNKRPVLSDLRESGNIEEAADKVLFIYRDEYYNSESQDQGAAEIICSKNRDGETGMEKLSWRPEVLKFGNLYFGG